MFYRTKEMMKNCGKDGPIESKQGEEKWRRCIWVFMQQINERRKGPINTTLIGDRIVDTTLCHAAWVFDPKKASGA